MKFDDTGSILSVERTRRGFVLHFERCEIPLHVRSRDRRPAEQALRRLGLQIVDEYGARIDESQFVKERDPAFNRKVGPGFAMFLFEAFAPLPLVNWVYRRRVRQSSDDA